MKLNQITNCIIMSVLICAVVVLCSSAEIFADAAAGKTMFKTCIACHSIESGKNMVGPSLFGVVGRGAGKVNGFKYSEAMQKSGLTWDQNMLTEYLKNPKGKIPGNKMPFAGVRNATDIANLIDYLQTLK